MIMPRITLITGKATTLMTWAAVEAIQLVVREGYLYAFKVLNRTRQALIMTRHFIVPLRPLQISYFRVCIPRGAIHVHANVSALWISFLQIAFIIQYNLHLNRFRQTAHFQKLCEHI